MPKQYMVELAQDERDELEAVLKSSTRRARCRRRNCSVHGFCWPWIKGLRVRL